jgi:hypothetical protein
MKRLKAVPSSFEDRLEQEALRPKLAASQLPPGKLRDELTRRCRQLKVTAHLNQWLTSPGLQPPH